jgi:hypothetical protein
MKHYYASLIMSIRKISTCYQQLLFNFNPLEKHFIQITYIVGKSGINNNKHLKLK